MEQSYLDRNPTVTVINLLFFLKYERTLERGWVKGKEGDGGDQRSAVHSEM